MYNTVKIGTVWKTIFTNKTKMIVFLQAELDIYWASHIMAQKNSFILIDIITFGGVM
jgi:hypothetical protein